MTTSHKNRIVETSTTVGTGAYALGGAVLGYQTALAAGCLAGETYGYFAEAIDSSGALTGAFEVGEGVYTAGVLTSTAVFSSSNAGGKVSWAAGSKRIGFTLTAERVVALGLGVAGATGAQGIQGVQGLPGAAGATGVQGIQGLIGATGTASTVAGPAGSAGAAGVQGTTGAAGSQGIQGTIGNTGSAGAAGVQGTTGLTGSAGMQGATGAAGANGTSVSLKGSVATVGALAPTGNTAGDLWVVTADGNGYVWSGTAWTSVGPIQGPAGATGPVGATGAASTVAGPAGAASTVAGPTGAAGAQGIQGLTGAQGIQGLTGTTGVAGAASTVAGPSGAQGIQGTAGTTGATGAASVVAGPTGATGPTGAAGTNGTIGVDGVAGAAGATGAAGVNGTSVSLKGSVATFGALPAALNAAGDLYVVLSDGNGYVWSGSTWTNVGPIRGPAGADGAQGVIGQTGAASVVAGPQGIQGTTGATGSTGTIGLTGNTGPAGATGDTGVQGIQGITGATGIQGLTGAAGTNGIIGVDGAQGIQGLTGLTGATGVVDPTLLTNEVTRATTAEGLLAPKASPTFTGTVTGITATMVGLGNVTNTSDAAKPVSTLQAAAIGLKADQATTYTKTESDAAIATVVGAAPAALNTLVELAAQMALDETAASALTTAVSLRAPIARPNFTGTVGGISAAMVGAPAGSGTSSGANTGDETTATIKTKLGVTTLSGSNTGDQVLPTLASLGAQAAGTYATGTGSASGVNTGDQVIPVASSTTPAALGVAAVGTGATFARGDHVHAAPAVYALPTAAAGTLGGVKVGTGLSIDGAGVLSAAGATNIGQGINTATAVTVTSSTGSSATLAGATTTLAGVMTAAQVIALNAATPQVLTAMGDIAYMGAGGIMQRLPASVVDNWVLTNHPNGTLSWQPAIPGQNASVVVGTVTTIASGSAATVTNGGDTLNAVFNFALPQGPAGIAGLAGSNSLLIAPFERWSIVTAARVALETLQINIKTASVWKFSNASVGSFSINLRGDATTTLASLLAVGDSCTVVVANTCGGTPYFPSSFSIDGVQVFPKWSGGLSPNAGNSNSVDFYAYVISRESASVYSIYANQTKYA